MSIFAELQFRLHACLFFVSRSLLLLCCCPDAATSSEGWASVLFSDKCPGWSSASKIQTSVLWQPLQCDSQCDSRELLGIFRIRTHLGSCDVRQQWATSPRALDRCANKMMRFVGFWQESGSTYAASANGFGGSGSTFVYLGALGNS